MKKSFLKKDAGFFEGGKPGIPENPRQQALADRASTLAEEPIPARRVGEASPYQKGKQGAQL